MIDEKRWCCRCGGQGHLSERCPLPVMPPPKTVDKPPKR